jgi:hypothetical protein
MGFGARYGSRMFGQRRTFGVAVAGAALVVSACAGTSDGVTRVRDGDRLVYFELPAGWEVIGDDQLAGLAGTPFVVQSDDLVLPILSRVVFHGQETGAGLGAADVSLSPVPIGTAAVRSISASQRDLISRYWLAEAVLAYHEEPVAQELLKQDITVAAGYDGVQLVVAYNDSETQADAAVAFVSVTDPEARRMFSIAIGCSLECYGENQAQILDIIDSWLVNTDA